LIGTTLILKIVLVPILIGAVSLAGRRWGPAISGWLIGLPLSSAPITFFLALEQGTAFAAAAAHGTLMGLISASLFCLVYGRLSRRLGWIGSTLAGWATYLIVTAALEKISIPLVLSFVAVVAVIAIVLVMLPARRFEAGAIAPPWWEIPLRMVAATSMVVAITAAAASLGPQLSGLLTPFPVYTTVLAVFTHAFQGSGAATGLLRGVQAGLFTFATFFFVVAGTLETKGLLTAFGLAALTALLLHGGSLWFLRRPAGSAATPQPPLP